VKELVERRHQRKEKDRQEREKEKTELGGGFPGEGRAPDVEAAVQENNGGRVLAKP
jgi:hypothetical protein